MEAPTEAPRLRPLDLGGTLDAAIRIVMRHAGPLMLAVLVVVLPLQLASLLITELTTRAYDVGAAFSVNGRGGGVVYDDRALYVAGQLANAVLAALMSLLSTVACFKIVADAYLGGRPDARSALALAARRLPAVLWLAVLLVVLLVCAFMLLVVPGIWLLVASAVVFPVLFVERVGGLGAVQRSVALVRGHWWRVFLTLLVAWIVAAVVTGAVSGALTAIAVLAVDSGSLGAHVLEMAANVVGNVLTRPLIAAVVVIVYFDLRVRKEGFDPAGLAGRLGAPPRSMPGLHRGFLPPTGADAR